MTCVHVRGEGVGKPLYCELLSSASRTHLIIFMNDLRLCDIAGAV